MYFYFKELNPLIHVRHFDEDFFFPFYRKKVSPRICWKPSFIPISVICLLIVFVIFFPLSEYKDRLFNARKSDKSVPNICSSSCKIELVESIPEGLVFPDDSPKFQSTYEAWDRLIQMAKKSINIGSFYWTLRGADFYNHSTAWQGEDIFKSLLNAGTKRNIKIRIAQSAPRRDSPNIDTEILVKKKAAEVRSVNFDKLFGGGVLHTKLWIVDGQHMYVGSANMDWRSLTQVYIIYFSLSQHTTFLVNQSNYSTFSLSFYF